MNNTQQTNSASKSFFSNYILITKLLKTMRSLYIVVTLALLGAFAVTAQAQKPAPFAGGITLQQAGGTNPALGLTLTAKQTYTLTDTLNFIQPTSNGILKVINWNGAGQGDVTVTSLNLATDVGSSILPIANGGTGASTANAALNNLLPAQTGDSGRFLQSNCTNTSWQTAVTSVGLSMPNIFSVTNSPVTTTGTLTATLVSQAAHTVFAAPISGAGTPSFRALDSTDIPNLNFSKMNGVLPISQGGTGVSSLPANGVLSVNGTGTGLVSTPLTAGQLLVGGSGGAPVATTLSAGTGISITNTGNGTITIAANANGANKQRYALSATQVSYTGNAVPAGFTLTATSVIGITVLEAGGFPITATVTNINTTNNTFDYVISGYPTANSFALVHFQN